MVCELSDDNVDACEGVVRHDDAVDDHGGHIQLLCALWPVAHGQDELRADEENACVPQDHEDIQADMMTERVNCGIGQRAGDEVEGEIEVGQGEERE